MPTNTLFTDDFKAQPYWWDGVSQLVQESTPLPQSIDVLVIGSGYTGLSAALQTVRAGRSTLIVDTDRAGGGCSSRNGGQVAHSIKPDYHKLARQVGTRTARGIHREGVKALDYLAQFISEEQLNCDWQRCGRFIGAHNRYRYQQLCAQARLSNRDMSFPMQVVPPHEMPTEIGSDFYHGGAVNPDYASLHPGKYVSELLRVVIADGAQVRSNCEVLGVEKRAGSFEVTTTCGQFHARDVIVATNGYTGKLFPRLRSRVIPIGSYMIATEVLPAEQINTLLPTRRMMVDTRKMVFYYRSCPQRQRILFGGRVAMAETDPRKSAISLHREMCRIFPGLGSVRVSHAWMGFVGYTFDHMPHLGKIDGIHYALGYCGSGVSLSSYFGMKIGQQVLGNQQGHTPLSNIEFPTRPYYSGRPWFLAPSIFYYRMRDRIPR